MLIEVAFKGNRKEFFLWEQEAPPPIKSAVIVDADRGEDLGFVHATGAFAEQRSRGVPHAPTVEEPVTRVARRLATADEVKKADELREQDEIARRKAMERVKANSLVMKLSDAEWRWDRRKLTIFFTAERRVDFRALVRELAAMFRTRIELKQIGVRDEAKRLGGIGRCGREYCSASWLPELRPVNLGVAKDQRLSLNPTQISGACGRLMCCLRYEHDFYVQQRKRFPKEGKIIETSRGEEKVVANDIFRERVTLRNAEGEIRLLLLAELRREWKNPTAYDSRLDDDTPAIEYEAISDEVLRLQDTSELPAWHPGLSLPVLGSSRQLPTLREEPQRGVVAPRPTVKNGGTVVPSETPAGRPTRPGRGQSAGGGPPNAGAPTDSPMPNADRGEDRDRQLRRRRGRRGGRRGRGGQEPGGDEPGGVPGDAGPGDVA